MGETAKQTAWKHFDQIVDQANISGASNRTPWSTDGDYEPDFGVLEQLLAVPLALNASSQSGVPALALDVWVAYELRRAGFAPDAVWPRAHHPRVMPTPVVNYAELAQKTIRDKIVAQLTRPKPLKGVVATDARILGRHYVKQVDVVMSAWETGPEILISTKRMDSSFGKNAANRIEEAYGDAKNLRARHPLAAHGFLYGLRTTILESEPDKARWLIDLLTKLAQEGDAYNAVCLLMLDYEGKAPEGSDGGHDDDEDAAAVGLSTEVQAGRHSETSAPEEEAEATNLNSSDSLIGLPKVSILQHPAIPEELSAGSFFKRTVELVLRSTPITMHPMARRARGWPTAGLALDETDV